MKGAGEEMEKYFQDKREIKETERYRRKGENEKLN